MRYSKSGITSHAFPSLINRGGLTVGSKDHTLSLIESDSPELGKVTPEILQGRKYCTVRAIGDHPSSGSGREQQKGLLKEFFSAIDEWEVS